MHFFVCHNITKIRSKKEEENIDKAITTKYEIKRIIQLPYYKVNYPTIIQNELSTEYNITKQMPFIRIIATRRVILVEQELPIRPDHLDSPQFVVGFVLLNRFCSV